MGEALPTPDKVTRDIQRTGDSESLQEVTTRLQLQLRVASGCSDMWCTFGNPADAAYHVRIFPTLGEILYVPWWGTLERDGKKLLAQNGGARRAGEQGRGRYLRSKREKRAHWHLRQ